MTGVNNLEAKKDFKVEGNQLTLLTPISREMVLAKVAEKAWPFLDFLCTVTDEKKGIIEFHDPDVVKNLSSHLSDQTYWEDVG